MTGLRADILQDAVAATSGLELNVIVHKSIDSTNSWSLQQCKNGKVLPFACFAEEQTLGRGRRGKPWIMSPRSNIAMSVCWPFSRAHQKLHLLPISIALAIVKTLERFDLKHVQIKWPNDVYVRDKKIAGVLIETRPIQQKLSGDTVNKEGAKDSSHTAVIVGVGLNYDMSPFGGKLENETIPSVVEITDVLREVAFNKIEQTIDRKMVASMLLQNVIDVCQNFQQNSQQNLEMFRAGYDYCNNKVVEILLDNQLTLSGIAQGVNDAAELLVMIDGEERAFNSAEVSVKADTQ